MKYRLFCKWFSIVKEYDPLLYICQFSVNLVSTGAVTSHSSVSQGRKCGVEGSESIDVTVGDHFVNLATLSGTLPQSRIVAIILLVNQK